MNLTSLLVHPVVSGIIGGICIVILAYIDTKCRKIERTQDIYIKLFLVSSLVFSTISYFVTSHYTKKDAWLEQIYDSEKPNLQPHTKMSYKKTHVSTESRGDFKKILKEIPRVDSNVSIDIQKK